MRLQRLWMVVGASVLVTACDIPTTPPILEQRWVLPLEFVSLDQAELLPVGVNLAGNFYDVTIAPVNFNQTLNDMCAACGVLDGMTVPTPPFGNTFNSTETLPNNVNSAEVVSGSIDITITNNLSFDPLANSGSIQMSVTGQGGSPVLGTLDIDGAAGATMPSGSVNNYNIVLGSGSVSGQIETYVMVTHPGGETATIDVTNDVVVNAVVSSLLVSSANVDVAGLVASLSNQTLDVDALESSLVQRIQSGSATLDITNPFGLTFTGSLTVGPVTKNVSIPADPTSQVTISYSTAELQQFLGQPGITMSGTGTIGGGPVDVSPSDEVRIDPTFDLVIHVGG